MRVNNRLLFATQLLKPESHAGDEQEQNSGSLVGRGFRVTVRVEGDKILVRL